MQLHDSSRYKKLFEWNKCNLNACEQKNSTCEVYFWIQPKQTDTLIHRQHCTWKGLSLPLKIENYFFNTKDQK